MKLTRLVYVPAGVLVGATGRYFTFANISAEVALVRTENFAGLKSSLGRFRLWAAAPLDRTFPPPGRPKMPKTAG